MEVLRITLTSGEEALPVFSSEEEAIMFLEVEALGNTWRVRVTAAGELTSVLFSLCAAVDRVVLDPLSGPFAETLMDLMSTGREAFMEAYLDSQKSRPLATDSGRRRRQGGVSAQAATLEGR